MSEEFKNMSHQHFYENFFLIDGKTPPPLSEFDKKVLSAFDNLEKGEQIMVLKGRGRHLLMKCIEAKIIKSNPQVKIIKSNNSKCENT